MASVGLLSSSESLHNHSGAHSFERTPVQSTNKIQDGLEVTESGKALKVQTDRPHLVSLGGGRLSTAVTLHPLPEGRTFIGTKNAPKPQDIVIEGTGVEREHCYIENNKGLVTLYPSAEMITVDGLHIRQPTRLTQGCMICLGRSNYFRFNHPQEAKLMKSILPNTRISVVPLNFCPVDNPEYFHVPGVASSKSYSNSEYFPISPGTDSSSSYNTNFQHDDDDDMESEDFVEKVSKFEYLAHSRSPPVVSNSQKWFVRDGIRSPASPPTSSSSYASSSHSIGTMSPVTSDYTKQSWVSGKPPPVPKVAPPVAPKPTTASASPLHLSPVSPTTISPKFISLTKIDPQISPKVFLPTKPAEKPRHLPGHCSASYHRQNGLGHHCSLEELRASQEKLEQQHRKVVKERIQEQELERQERQRLEEILNLCAEYERQSEKDKNTKCVLSSSPHSPHLSTSPTESWEKRDSLGHSPILSSSVHHVHMNRIKTNGSLPRDRINHTPSPGDNNGGMLQRKPIKSTSSEDELNRIFNVERSTTPVSPADTSNRSQSDAKCSNGYSTYPQSPRTRIRTVVNCNDHNDEIYENRLAVSEYQLSLEGVRLENTSPSSQRLEQHKTQQTQTFSKNLSPENVTNQTNNSAPQGMQRQNLQIPPQYLPSTSPDDVFVMDRIQLSLDSAEIARKLPMEPKEIQRQKAEILHRINDIKHDIGDIDIQVEEVIRELEMECALLKGECQALSSKINEDQIKLNSLKQREQETLKKANEQKSKERAKIDAARSRLESLEKQLHEMEENLKHQSQGSTIKQILEAKIKHHHELIDSERKGFEDLEFHQFENEAHYEEEREQIIQEYNELKEKCRLQQIDLKDIEQQKDELNLQAKKEIEALEKCKTKLIEQLKNLKEILNEIDGKLKALNTSSGNDSDTSPRSSDGEYDLATQEITKTLQIPDVQSRTGKDSEVLIHQVTSRSPIFISEGPAGNKATARLMEIERNRQLILEKQGSYVIEEERKRVQELKKKAADEVRAQWEERKQREANCHSFNSVESEGSSATSSDIPPESLSSDDFVEKNGEKDSESYIEEERAKEITRLMRQRERELQNNVEDTKPLFESSQESYDIKYREKPNLQQRPLTRYLPIRCSNFDLKHHIESAGHQIELCPHVQLTSTACRGYLSKLGTKFRNWNKRWFVFDRNQRILSYYADKNENRARGIIYFQSILEVYVDHLHSVKSANPKLTFCVKTGDRVYYLLAPSAEAMRIWIDVIFTGAEGYQEFQLDT